MSLMERISMRILFLFFFIISTIDAVGCIPKGETSGTSKDDEQLISIREPFLGNLDRDHGFAIDGRIRPFVDEFNNDYLQYRKAVLEASWKYETTREDEMDRTLREYEYLILRTREKLEAFDVGNSRILDGKLKNQIQRVNYLIRTTLPTDLRRKVESILKKADTVYRDDMEGTGEILRNSQNSLELFNSWLHFVKNTGPKIKSLFGQYFQALKEVAKYQGFNTTAIYLWYKEGIIDSFNPYSLEFKMLCKFHLLHTLLRYYLHVRLVESLKPRSSIWDNTKLPHLMIIHEWGRINANNEALLPYRGVHDVIQKAIVNKSSTLDWLELANIYYHESLGFAKLNISDIRRKLVQLKGRATTARKNLVVWNLFNGDYRIMWSRSDTEEEDMFNMFKAVGYIHNFKAFQDLEPIHQDWTSEIFGEAIVGAASLSAFSPSGLTRLGVLDSSNVSESVIINRQLKSILYHFTLRLGMTTDTVTEEMYRDHFQFQHYEYYWWSKITLDLSIIRSYAEYDFAPSTVENLLYGNKYTKEFMSEILKYQFFQRLCVVAGQFDPQKPNSRPLYKCDLSSSNEAQTLIQFAMHQGNTLSWKALIKLMTNSDEFESDPLINYYFPLIDWLKPVVDLPRSDLYAEKLVGYIPNIFQPE